MIDPRRRLEVHAMPHTHLDAGAKIRPARHASAHPRHWHKV